MQHNHFIEDMTKVMTSAVTSAFEARRALEDNFRQNVARTMRGFGFVAQEELQVVKDMAAAARKENEELRQQVQKLEKNLTSKPAASPKEVPARDSAKKKA